MKNKNLDKYEEIKKMNGQRKINGLAFYDILQNPDYRMRFEYADPIGMDNNGKFIFDDEDNNLTEEQKKFGQLAKLMKKNIQADLKLAVKEKERNVLKKELGESFHQDSIHKERQNQLPLEILNLMFLKDGPEENK